MRSPILSGLVLLLGVPLAHAGEFSCGSRYCQIPYDSEGVQNGIETCWADETKATKVRELTWKDGKRTGPARCWDKGRLTIQANFLNNELHGLYVDQRYGHVEVQRYERGRLSGYRLNLSNGGNDFHLGSCYRDDQVEDGGESFCRGLDYGPYQAQVNAHFAKLKAQEKVKEAKLNGPQVEKYGDGKIRAKYVTREGEIQGDFEAFWPNGQLKARGKYQDGKREGEFTYYHESGYVIGRDVYQGDRPVKIVKILQNGKNSSLEEWVTMDGKKRYCSESFHENGQRAIRSCRSDRGWYGVADGEFVWWNEQGRPVLMGQNLDGQRAGTWKYFSETGEKLTGEASYEKGVLVREWYVNQEGRTVRRDFFPDGSLKSERIE